jgi:4'-phosphopantetheinyl transferase
MRRPERLNPHGRDVHLWVIQLEASQDNFERSLSWLSPEESARAERFHFPRHQRAFVLGRAALRGLLANYLAMDPAEVGFVYGPQGKPSLAPPLLCDPHSLRFNASNSGNLAAFAFTIGCEIGVDIEQHRALREFQNIAHRFFSPEEAAELLELPDAAKTEAFFHCWTRKEAYIKSLGGGLSIPLDSFRVTLWPGAAARMVSLEGSEDAARGWTLHDFDPAPGHAGAIAYPDTARALQSVPLLGMDELLDNLA